MKVGDLVDAGLAEIRTGPFGTQLKASDYVSDGRPVLNVRNVGFGEVRPDKLEYVDEETAERLSGHILQDGDIVFGRKGAVERHAFIRGSFVGALQGSDCIRLRISRDAPIRAHLASFALRTQEHQDWMQSFCSHGATMASLNQEILKQIVLPDLGLQSQDAVIGVLGAFDDLIDNNRRRIELLEQMTHAIYREWFVRLQYPGHEEATCVDSQLGPTPEGWEQSTVGQITSFLSRGISPKYDEDGAWRVVNQRCIRDGRISLDVARRHGGRVSPPKAVRSGDVLVNSTGVGTLGRVGVFLEEHDALTVDSHVTIVRPQDALMQPWFGLQMLQRQSELEAMGIGSTGQTELGRQAIGELPVILPASDILRRFADLVWPLIQPVPFLLGENRTLASLRDHLLPRLVSGRIDVSSLDLGGMVESVA